MRDWKGSRRAAALALTLALFTLGATREAGAHPRGHVVVTAASTGGVPGGVRVRARLGTVLGLGSRALLYGYPAAPT